MSDTPSKLYKVELYIEVPATVAPPDQWNWDNIVNGPDLPADKHTPVFFVRADETKEGNA